jgi:hypothetical protein
MTATEPKTTPTASWSGTKWEYYSECLSLADVMPRLKVLGEQGFELISVTILSHVEREILLKRQTSTPPSRIET